MAHLAANPADRQGKSSPRTAFLVEREDSSASTTHSTESLDHARVSRSTRTALREPWTGTWLVQLTSSPNGGDRQAVLREAILRHLSDMLSVNRPTDESTWRTILLWAPVGQSSSSSTTDDPVEDRVPLVRRPGQQSSMPSSLIKFLQSLIRLWGLERDAAATLLGLEPRSIADALAVFEGRVAPTTRDQTARIGELFTIRKRLSSLFRNIEAENEWLRQPNPLLGNETPLELLLEGSFANLLRVRYLVDHIAGL
jgi:hypothetical protein